MLNLRAKARRMSSRAWLLVFLLGTGASFAQERNITTADSIEQDQLGTYTVTHVLLSGRQFFANNFTPADGHGEGDADTGSPGDGDRAGQRYSQWAGSTTYPHFIPFLRVNGIDSQSCFACHNTAGTYAPTTSGGVQAGLTQKPGGVGGAGDFAVALLSDSDFPNTLSHFLRVPPRAFGSAYLQELALEMTADLMTIEQDTVTAAEANIGTEIDGPLITKGVDFGVIKITCYDSACNSEDRDTTAVVGVQPDLIVRPFQHKGVAATLRSFVKTALDFHHSMQGVELVGDGTDCDNDGKYNEMAVDVSLPTSSGTSHTTEQQSLGNVAALTAFTGMLRPPTQEGCASGSACAEGKQLFDTVGCTSCHVSSLPIAKQNPKFQIQLPDPASPRTACPAHHQLGSYAEVNASPHPALKAATDPYCGSGYYCINLNSTITGTPLPSEFRPRLPDSNGYVSVPLFSDLKRHAMGCFLAQQGGAQADDSGNDIPNDEWLTSKLWGVSANGPWLHDGRARTLQEAIIMHNGYDGMGHLPNSEGGCQTTVRPSEAADSITAFLALSDSQQGEIIDFLESLVIPLPPSS